MELRSPMFREKCISKFMSFSSDLMKLQGVLLQKWFIGYRLALCLSLICFRRHQNGVHETLIIITWNEHNLLMWPYFFTKWCLMRLSKIMVSLTWRVSKCVVFSGRQLFFIYGDLHFSGLEIQWIQPDMLKFKISCYSSHFKMCL